MRRSRLVAVAAVAVFTMVGAGCGGDDEPSDSSDDSVSSSDDGGSGDSPEAEPSDAETDPADEPSDDPTEAEDKPSEESGAPLEPQTVVDACQDATDGGTWPAVDEVDIQPDGEGVVAKAEVDLDGQPVMFFCSVIGTNDKPEVMANNPVS